MKINDWSCSQSCLQKAWCTSANFVMSSKNGKGTFELNKHEKSLSSTQTANFMIYKVLFSLWSRRWVFQQSRSRVVGIRGLRGVESTCLPPVMWPAFNPGAVVRSGWSLSLVIVFVVRFIFGFCAWFSSTKPTLQILQGVHQNSPEF